MNTSTIFDSLRQNVQTAQATASMVANHGQDLVHTGMETLRSAKDVLDDARREVQGVINRTRGELRSTFQEGREKLSYKFQHLATPTRKEEAAARKLEVKAKKQRKSQAGEVEIETESGTASAAGFTPPPSVDAT